MHYLCMSNVTEAALRWERATHVTRRQHGLITTQQLNAAGFANTAIHLLVKRGRLRRVHRGVFEIAGQAPSFDRLTLAAVLASGDGAMICAASAIHLHDLPGLVSQDGIHVLRSWHAKGRHVGVRVHRSRLIVPADRATKRGIAVVSVSRAIVDVSGHPAVDDRMLEWMVDVARRRGLSLDALDACAARLGPGPGRRPGRVRSLVERRQGTNPAESPPELWVAQVLEDAGYGRPQLAIPVVTPGGQHYRIDGGYLDCLSGFEYQSWQEHGNGMWLPFHADPERAGRLKMMGWDLTSITSETSAATIVAVIGAVVERRRRAITRGLSPIDSV